MARYVYVRNMSLMKQATPVYRIEAQGEAPIPFPSLAEAMIGDPAQGESLIVTSRGGVVLCEATPWEPGQAAGCSLWIWIPTIAGADVLRGCVCGLSGRAA